MGESLNQIKHCSFPYISGQLLSLLYQDVCPTIRPITFDFLLELHPDKGNPPGTIAIPSSNREERVMAEGEGHLTTAVCVHVDKSDGGQKPFLDNMAPRQLAE